MLKEALMYRRRADLAFRWGLVLTFIAVMLLLRGVAWAQEAGPGPTVDGSVGSHVLNAFLQYVLPPLVMAIAALIGLAFKRLSDFLHVKAKGSEVGTALVAGADFVMTAVQHTISGLAPDVKAALANDGKIDSAEREQLKTKALALIKAELPAGIGAVLGGVMEGGLGTWLSGKAEQAIDAAVANASASTPGSSAPVPMPAPTSP